MGFNKVQFVALEDCLNITCLVAIQIQNEILLSNFYSLFLYLQFYRLGNGKLLTSLFLPSSSILYSHLPPNTVFHSLPLLVGKLDLRSPPPVPSLP